MKIAVLYINGLGTGEEGSRERFLVKHWEKTGVAFVCAGVNWYDGDSFPKKKQAVERKLQKLLKTHDKVILLGSSAGGSLALNVFADHPSDKLYYVNAHGRLRKGVQRWPDYRTLEWAAHLKIGPVQSQAFYDSVVYCEQKTLLKLTQKQLRRILVLKPLVDLVVPIYTMSIPGVLTVRSLALGHKLAGVNDLVVARNRILRFANAIV